MTPALAAAIVAMRAFVPAKDFQTSLRFYEAFGFESRMLGDALASLQFGDHHPPVAFLLQDFYVKDFAENLMMQLAVADLDAWWAHIESLDLARAFGVRTAPPKQQPWGRRVAYVWDPAGVLWHVTEDPAAG